MKTSSRKRLLVSSVAMLLVAMLALGTATFAWFTSSTTSTASGINVQTIKSSKLEISKLNKAWGTTVDYGMTNTAPYLPVSSADGSNWFTANAAEKDKFDPKAGSADTTDKYYFKEQLNVRNSGEADVKDAFISFTLDDATKPEYVRVALVPVADTEDNTTVLPVPNSSDFVANIYGKDTTAYQALTGKNVTTDLSENIEPKNVFKVDLGTDGVLTAGQTVYYNLYVWFEGQDADCYGS